MRPSDENLITCTNGHTTARKLWRLFDPDPVYLCCPVCGELSDRTVPEIAQPPAPSPIPVGRQAIHVVSLIAKVEAWRASRAQSGFNNGCLREVLKYLDEYRALLAASDLELVAGHDLDRLLDPLPREIVNEAGYGDRPETDAEFRERAKRAPIAEHQTITVSHALRTLPTFRNQPVPAIVTREDVERAEKIAEESRPIGTRSLKLIVP